MRLDPARTAMVAIDMHRGHLDPSVATLPLAAERCGPVIKRAAALFAALRERAVPIVHVVTEYRDAGEIAANPFWTAAHDDPGKARRGILRHNLAGSPGTEIIAELHAPRDLVVRGKKRYSSFHGTDLEFLLRRRLGADTRIRRHQPRLPGGGGRRCGRLDGRGGDARLRAAPGERRAGLAARQRRHRPRARRLTPPSEEGRHVEARDCAVGRPGRGGPAGSATGRHPDRADQDRHDLRFDDYGNPIMNIYVRKVERVSGRLQNSVVHTFPSVSQFWTYKPEEFLKQPVYDRNNPPCKHCQ